MSLFRDLPTRYQANNPNRRTDPQPTETPMTVLPGTGICLPTGPSVCAGVWIVLDEIDVELKVRVTESGLGEADIDRNV